MGGQTSQPVQKARTASAQRPPQVSGSVLRKAGEPLNTLGYQALEKVLHLNLSYSGGT